MRPLDRLVFRLVLLAVLAVLPTGFAAAQPTDAGPGTGPVLTGELVRLDERLDLGTFPDGSGEWAGRAAASLEQRLRAGDAPAADLMHRLALQLRDLGTEHALDPLPGSEAPPAGAARDERLAAALATVRALHAKLDAPAAPPAAAPAALPANDDCAAAVLIGNGTTYGTTAGAGADGTASCGNSDGAPDVWYRYVVPLDGVVGFDTFGSSFDTVLSVSDGCPDPATRELACSDDADGTGASRVFLGLASGQEVWVRVSGYGGAAGTFALTVAPSDGIAGVVTRSDTGEPLAGVTVAVHGEAGHLLHTGTTTVDGSFGVGGVEDGTYFVRTLGAPDMVDEIWDDVACPGYGSCVPHRDGAPVVVDGGPATGIDFALTPAGVIAGTVTDAADSLPIAAFLSLYPATGSIAIDTFYTGPGGTFELTGLPPGKYRLGARAGGYQQEMWDDVPCELRCVVSDGALLVVTGGSTFEADFALQRLGALAGTLTEDPSGQPLASQSVVVSHATRGSLSGYSRSDGTYRVEGLLAGTYRVRTRTWGFLDEVYDDLTCADAWCSSPEGTPVSVALESTTGGIDFDLARLGEIRGTVLHRPTGDPLSASVRIFDAAGQYKSWVSTSSLTGAYALQRLWPGTYYVLATDPRLQDELYPGIVCEDACEVTAGAPVEVTLGSVVDGVDFLLDRLGIIRGRLLSTQTGGSVGGSIDVYDASGNRVRNVYNFQGFEVAGLQEGSYTLKTRIWGSNGDLYQDELFADVPCEPDCDLSLGTPIPIVLNGVVEGVDLSVESCPASTFLDLSGTYYVSVHAFEACERLRAGAGLVLAPSSDVTFRAGRSIVLEPGFSALQGARFRTVLEPSWRQP